MSTETSYRIDFGSDASELPVLEVITVQRFRCVATISPASVPLWGSRGGPPQMGWRVGHGARNEHEKVCHTVEEMVALGWIVPDEELKS